MALIKVTDATEEPIGLAEAKKHLEETLDDAENDEFIEWLIGVARQAAEDRTGRTLLATTWKLSRDCFPRVITLERGPVQSVEWVKYYDDEGDLQTLATDQYEVDTASTPARIVPAYGVTWPATRWGKPGAVQVQYVAGYADVSAIPKPILHWIKLALTDLYQNRGRSAERPTVPQDFAEQLLGDGHTTWSP